MKLSSFLKPMMMLCFLPMLFISASVTGVASAAPLACSWKIVSSPNPGFPDGLGSVAAVSATDAWAVGSSGRQSGSGQPIIEQWNGTQWSAVSSPSTGTLYSTLTSVAVVSANDIWAVGWEGVNGIAETLTEHWDGTQWNIVSSPDPGSAGNEFFSVAVVSTNDVWAVGNSQSTTTIGGVEQTLVEHWNGTQWSVVSSPNPVPQVSALTGVAAVSSSDVLAVGFYVGSNGIWDTLTEQWNGTQWSVVSSPSPGTQINYLASVAATSANDAWAVGYADSQTLTEHWNGTQWSVVSSSGPGPVSNSLLGVAEISTSNVWAVGYYQTSDFVAHTLTEHWNGKQWHVVKSPSPGTNSAQFEGVAATSPTDVWAVGHSDSTTLVEHYC
ncbi:MAG TPA: hypothetical protein VFA09_10715 [Ktedonobacteraceae bacterium]|nr:hypothetical protein [Ktedonobacteraceae bacterium]